MKKILVKDGDWLADMYGWNRIKVYVGMTKAQFLEEEQRERVKNEIDQYMGYSGYDEHQASEWDHE